MPPNSARSRGQLVALWCLIEGTANAQSSVTANQARRSGRPGTSRAPLEVRRATANSARAIVQASQRPPSWSKVLAQALSREAKPWASANHRVTWRSAPLKSHASRPASRRMATRKSLRPRGVAVFKARFGSRRRDPTRARRRTSSRRAGRAPCERGGRAMPARSRVGAGTRCRSHSRLRYRGTAT